MRRILTLTIAVLAAFALTAQTNIPIDFEGDPASYVWSDLPVA